MQSSHNMQSSHKRNLIVFLAISFFASALLAACSGPTTIDVNFDPTTGAGNIIVNPPPQEPTPVGAGTTGDVSQVALFAIVVIVLLGVMAIVFSVARRPRREE